LKNRKKEKRPKRPEILKQTSALLQEAFMLRLLMMRCSGGPV
jgi:hypothetical protein